MNNPPPRAPIIGQIQRVRHPAAAVMRDAHAMADFCRSAMTFAFPRNAPPASLVPVISDETTLSDLMLVREYLNRMIEKLATFQKASSVPVSPAPPTEDPA